MKQNSMRDPVCEMTVNDKSLHVEYLGSYYYFCSEQCKERFVTNPALYVGRAGIPSPKQQGMQMLKQRVIRLDVQITNAVQEQIVDMLSGLMGVKQVSIEGDVVRICYDLLEATAEQIEQAIEESGARLGNIWKDRLKRAFVHYLEETELENLEHQHESHGCHH